MERNKRPELIGERIPIKNIHKMLEEERKKLLPNLPWADEEEYLRANKSKRLEIIKDSQTGLYKIIHRLEKETIVVPTPEEILKKYKIVSLQGHNCYFATALLLQFHGQPCERQSVRIGGVGYDRI